MLRHGESSVREGKVEGDKRFALCTLQFWCYSKPKTTLLHFLWPTYLRFWCRKFSGRPMHCVHYTTLSITLSPPPSTRAAK